MVTQAEPTRPNHTGLIPTQQAPIGEALADDSAGSGSGAVIVVEAELRAVVSSELKLGQKGRAREKV